MTKKSHVGILPVLAALGVVSFAGQTDKTRTGHPSTCPYGHATLTNIPIVYGAVMPSEDLSKAIASYRFILGGCVRSSDSPTNAILCATCEFVFRPPQDTWDHGSWSRVSTNLQSFRQPFPALLLSFSPSNRTSISNGPVYSQVLREGKAFMSSVEFSTTEALASLKERIEGFLATNNLRAGYEERIFSAEAQRRCDFYEWHCDSPFFAISVRHDTNDASSVSIAEAHGERAESPRPGP